MTHTNSQHTHVLGEVIAWRGVRTHDATRVLTFDNGCKVHIWTFRHAGATEHLVIHQQDGVGFAKWEVRTGEIGDLVDEYVARYGRDRPNQINLDLRTAV